jgi:RNA polymerase sigma factor (sigma-70 family)
MKTEAMPAVELSDADLVAETLSGNRDAFGQIVQRYQTLIASLAYSATGNVCQSEDLAQETFVTAWKQLAELREPAKLRPWLCSITRFIISKQVRRQSHEPIHEAQSLDALDECTSPEPLPLAHAISQEELSLLWRSLERIPPAYREPLILFYREHQSIEAVAKGLGLSEDAVKQRLSRGRKFLQEQFMAFVAGALDQTRPAKTFALGVLAALPLAGVTAKAATVGTALAKHGSLATKTTSGFLQGIAHVFLGMVYWVGAALPLGGYIGYKMGGDSQKSVRARWSVAAFWCTLAISMLLLFFLPLLLAPLLDKITHVSGAELESPWVNLCVPIFMFAVVPLSLVFWIWQRRRRTAPERALGGPISGKSPPSVTPWVVLAMTFALLYLTFLWWGYIRFSQMHIPKTRYVSTSEVQNLIVNPMGRDIRFTLFQTATGARTLCGDLTENGTNSSFIAPAENSTMALLTEKDIFFETKIEGRDFPARSMTRVGWRSQRLLTPFCCFILVGGAATLLRGRNSTRTGQPVVTGPSNERRVDRAFAALAACAMLAMAVAVGLTTDWTVRQIAADQVANVIAQHSNARFDVFQYRDGSRKLWISDGRTPNLIAPANEASLGLLTRQGITYQTYVAGAAGFPGRSQANAVLWIVALATASGGLLWWAVKGLMPFWGLKALPNAHLR